MWTLWWIFPLLGFLVCLGLIVMMVRAMRSGAGFVCMGGQHQHRLDETADLRRELGELRKEFEEIRASR